MRIGFLARLAAVVVPQFALAACFLSEEPLIAASEAYTRYATLEFHEIDSDDGATLTRDGTVYRGGDGDSIELTFRQVGDGLVIAQLREDVTADRYLYALLRVDEAAGTAKAYAALSRGTEARPGLEQCENIICIRSLDAYIAHATALEASGVEPELTYRFTGTK